MMDDCTILTSHALDSLHPTPEKKTDKIFASINFLVMLRTGNLTFETTVCTISYGRDRNNEISLSFFFPNRNLRNSDSKFNINNILNADIKKIYSGKFRLLLLSSSGMTSWSG